MGVRDWTRAPRPADAARMRFLRVLSLATLAACAPAHSGGSALEASASLAGVAPDQPVELGLVHWERDHDAAFARAARESKPVLLLFQEVPG